jgi:hypothetical protein
MEGNCDRPELLALARKRVEEVKGFYIHLGVYVIVNSLLFTINMITSPDTRWFIWPLLGWGIGLALHAFSLVTEQRILGPEWEDRKVQEILDRDEKRRLDKSA